MAGKILMILASKNFRDIEYITPRAFFEQNGYEVKTASSVEVSEGRFGYKVHNDFKIDDLDPFEWDGVFLVGGGGSLEYIDNEIAQTLFEVRNENDLLIGAICAAPQNFIHWGIANQISITGFNKNGEIDRLEKDYEFINHTSENVVIDGNIITGNGPEAAEEFALKFMELINR